MRGRHEQDRGGRRSHRPGCWQHIAHEHERLLAEIVERRRVIHEEHEARMARLAREAAQARNG